MESKWQKDLDFSGMEVMLKQMKDALLMIKKEEQRKIDDILRLKIQQSKQNGLEKRKG